MSVSFQRIRYGHSSISFQLVRDGSRRNKIAIHVHPDGLVRVDAPLGAHLVDVKRAVGKRAGWICRQKTRFIINRETVLPREYVSGESHYYLGKRYLLKIISVKTSDESVKLKAGQLQVRTKNRSTSHVKMLLQDWYATRADMVFDDCIVRVYAKLPWVKDLPIWRHKPMSSRWGSCSAGGKLSLNTHLIKASKSSIEYVIFHELCHLKERNHGQDFYQLLSRYLRNWAEVKQLLDKRADVYLNV